MAHTEKAPSLASNTCPIELPIKSTIPTDVKPVSTAKEIPHKHRPAVLGKATEGKEFIVSGRKATTLYELIDELETMTEDEFRPHVEGKNDFADWIRFVFEDRPLAAEIQNLTSKKELQCAVLKHMVKELKGLK